MRLISDRDLRNYPGKVREALAEGEVVVTSRGKPYAVMLPVDDPARLEDTLKLASRIRAQMAVSEIRRRAVAVGLDRITEEDIEEEIRQVRNQVASGYYINKNAQPNGDHEVHRLGCAYIPDKENRIYLGNFCSCHKAISEARKHYPRVNGCYYCMAECHSE